MRAKWMTIALAAVGLMMFASNSRADDDVLGIASSRPLQVGGLSLAPGSYVLHISDRYPNYGVIVVTDADRRQVLGKAFVRTGGDFGEPAHDVTTLVFSAEVPGRLSSIAIGGKTTHYVLAQ